MHRQDAPAARRGEWLGGASSFVRAVPYRLWKPAAGGSHLLVALHGMGEDEVRMEDRLSRLTSLRLAVLVPRAPYPFELRDGERIRIGHAWYQYDGDAARFVASMDEVREYVFPLIDRVARACGTDPRRSIMLGYSQGAYLAYYLALRHPDRFAGVVGIAGRPKDEVLESVLPAARGARVLHLHGESDRVVSAAACRESVEALSAHGIVVDFRVVPGGHEISAAMVDAVAEWLRNLGVGADDGPSS
jgi:phospholipase/carboxylesterase